MIEVAHRLEQPNPAGSAARLVEQVLSDPELNPPQLVALDERHRRLLHAIVRELTDDRTAGGVELLGERTSPRGSTNSAATAAQRALAALRPATALSVRTSN